MMVFPDDNSKTPRVMYVGADWITETMKVVLDIACQDPTFLGPTEKGFNLHFSKMVSVKSAEGTYSRKEFTTDQM